MFCTSDLENEQESEFFKKSLKNPMSKGKDQRTQTERGIHNICSWSERKATEAEQRYWPEQERKNGHMGVKLHNTSWESMCCPKKK